MSGKSVTKSSGVIAVMTMLSRCLGLLRDMLMAGLFGTGIKMSAFVIAFTIPNLFRRLFGEGALSAAFVPVFIETRRQSGEKEAWRLARRIITIVAALLAVLVLLGLFLIDWVLAEWNPDGMPGAVLPLLRIMLPYMFFICLAALAMAILNSFKRFAVPAAMPCVLNIIWISALLFVVPQTVGSPAGKIEVVAWAVLIAGAAQLLGQLPSLWRRGYRPGIDFDLSAPKVRRIFILMGPAALGLAVTQINVVIDRILAAWVAPWGPAALFFSERLIYLPLGVFATAMGTALLPALSEHVAKKDGAGLVDTLTISVRNILLVLIPAAIGLFALSDPIIDLLFGWGAFDTASTAQTAIALRFYAPGLIFFGLAKLLVPTFYAHQDTKTPVKLSVLTVFLNLTLNITFVLTWPANMKHAGLAFATVLAEGFYVLALGFMLRKSGIAPRWRGISRSILCALTSGLLMGICAAILHKWVATVLVNAGVADKLGQLISVLGSIAAAAGIYFLLYFLAIRSQRGNDPAQR